MANIQTANTSYIAEVTCGKQALASCFSSQPNLPNVTTSLEVRSGQEYKLYQYQELMNKGSKLTIPLKEHFSIRAQNTSNTWLLSIVIKDKTSGKILFQKSAGLYDY